MRGFMLLLALTTTAEAATLPRFPPSAVWNQDVSALPLKHPNSDNMINHLAALGGWGTGATAFKIDFSFHVLHANAGAPTTAVTPYPDASNYYYPDCGDFNVPGSGPVPLPIPLPPGGGIEDPYPPPPAPTYTCDNANNDCHLLIVQGNTLFESFQTNVTGSGVEAACALTWDLSKVYPPQGRGDQCTSADAAGFPIAPLLFNADEVYAAEQATNGDLGHAIRFILKNSRMMKGAFVHPASHGTSGTGEHGASDTSPDAVPYGSRLRLKAGFDVANFTAGNHGDGGTAADSAARVILRTLQKYGMVLSDGGNVPLTAESDWYTTHKWSEFGMDPDTQTGSQLLYGIAVTDFEVVHAGDPIALTYDCDSNGNHMTPADFIFIDGYDF